MDWIKCSEQMPEKDVVVVICDKEAVLELAWRDKDGWWWSYNGYADFSEVLCWYPLPKLPKI